MRTLILIRGGRLVIDGELWLRVFTRLALFFSEQRVVVEVHNHFLPTPAAFFRPAPLQLRFLRDFLLGARVPVRSPLKAMALGYKPDL